MRPLIVLSTCIVLIAGCGGGSSSSSTTSSTVGTASATGTVAPSATTTAPSTRSRAHVVIPTLKPAKGAAPTHLPPSVIATVAGEPIKRSDFARAYRELTHSFSATSLPNDPPGYSRCIAALKRQRAQLSSQQPPPPISYRDQCRQRHASIVQATMFQLVQQRWTAQQARKLGVSVSAAEVDAALAHQRKGFGTAAKWSAYLKGSGMTISQLRGRLRMALLMQKISKERGRHAKPQTMREATRCAPGYVAIVCSNAPAPGTQ